jgi:DMSO reductase family type II enzyme chaperone
MPILSREYGGNEMTLITSKYDEALARSAVYEFLSLAFLYPEEEVPALLVDGARLLGDTNAEALTPEVKHFLGEISRLMAALGPKGFEDEYVEVFGHTISNDCPPYESEYDQAHVFQKTGVLSDLSSFYGAFGVMPDPELKERLDHLSVELEFMQVLTAKEAYALMHSHGEDKVLLCRRAQEGFLVYHLAHWAKAFADRLYKKAGPNSVYAPLAGLLDSYMGMELKRFGLDAVPDQPVRITSPEQEDNECDAMATPPRHGIGTIPEAC